MNEVKTPKKPFYVYYAIVLLALFLINALLVPRLTTGMVKQVDYDTFMKMTLDKQIDEVEVQDNQIIFTAKDDSTIYKTGVMNDPDLTQRLYDSGAKFSSEIVEQMSPLLGFFLSWILPILIFFALGQILSRKLMKKMFIQSLLTCHQLIFFCILLHLLH